MALINSMINPVSGLPITSAPSEGIKVWIDPNDDPDTSDGIDIPAQDTEPATGNYWLDTQLYFYARGKKK